MRQMSPMWSFVFFSSLTFLSLSACVQKKAPETSDTLGAVGKKVTDNIEDGVYDNSYETPVYALIGQAQYTLNIEIYEMKDPDVILALGDAVKRGVDVRIVMESQPVGVCNLFNDSPSTSDSCTEQRDRVAKIKATGAKVVPFNRALCGDGSANCWQHGKLILADKRVAMVSTGNFNPSSFCNVSNGAETCNRDFSVVTRDATVIKGFQDIFDKDFAGQPYDLNAVLTPPVRQKVTVSPVSLPAILQLLKDAKSSISIEAQYLKDPAFNQEVVAAAKRGVRVDALIASGCSFSTYKKEGAAEQFIADYQPLVDAGVQLKFFTKANKIGGKPAYMHAKVIMVDNKRAWIGSMNGSEKSSTANREFGLILDRADFIGKVQDILQKDFASASNETLAQNAVCTAEKNLASR